MAPELFATDNIAKLVALSYKWFHVPNLEGNNQWVKNGLGAYFAQKGALIKLSDVMTEGKRTHSIIRMFKKYGTQSAIRTFKNKQVKEWGFAIEVNKYKEKDEILPLCREEES